MTIQLKNWTSEELASRLANCGVTPRIARQLQASAVRRDAWPDHAPDISPRILDRVRVAAAIPQLDLVARTVSPADGFSKYAFRGEGPGVFEAVRIPLLHRPGDEKYVVCVSSQTGCTLGCAFCATGKLGPGRDLATWEIVDQVRRVQADSDHPIRGVVFMGMGEPLLNYEAALRAARILAEPCGMAISAKTITVSTAGIVPGIRRFIAERTSFRLVVSLSFADPTERARWMPVEREHPTAEIIDILREFHDATGERVHLAWTMIAGVNTREEDARQLAALTRGLPLRLDLIDVNDPSGRLQPPSQEELDAFRDALRRHLGMPVARRYSGGRDIAAACGMLAGDLT